MLGRRERADLGETLRWTRSTRCRARERDAGAPKGLQVATGMPCRGCAPSMAPGGPLDGAASGFSLPARCPRGSGCGVSPPADAIALLRHAACFIARPSSPGEGGKAARLLHLCWARAPLCAGYELLQGQGTGLSPSASTPPALPDSRSNGMEAEAGTDPTSPPGLRCGVRCPHPLAQACAVSSWEGCTDPVLVTAVPSQTRDLGTWSPAALSSRPCPAGERRLGWASAFSPIGGN